MDLSDSWFLDEVAHAGRENLDGEHVARYDAKMDAEAGEEARLLRESGHLTPPSTVVDLGAGTGQFSLATAPACARVVAVDVSPVMLDRLRANVVRSGLDNVECVAAGFLTYEHRGLPADVVYSRYALHHLPDFWKGVALGRVATMLRPGGAFRLSDAVYNFEPHEAAERIEAWITETMADDVEHGWTRGELAEHVRDEHSTFTWLLEPMLDRCGFRIVTADYSESGIFARYLCVKR
ncbi:MAG: class I SAM-dependent methyltransferase [Acidimicrobiales bacterium]